uniref:Uncharacterized protein n=1 Tax=Iconisemion striatum TaxID=60296 RepID=A0A1A7Y9V7_9TELE
MHKRCLMLRPRMQTSSPLGGRGAGTPCTTSCRVPLTLRGESCPSACLYPSFTSTPEEEMEMMQRTTRVPTPLASGRRSRGTAELQRAAGWITGTMMRNLFM